MNRRWIGILVFSQLFFSSLYADAKAGYSIQILSRPLKNSRPFDMKKFDASCYRVIRDDFEAVRCGCSEQFENAVKNLLPKFRKRYKSAFVANCDRRAYRNRQKDRDRQKGKSAPVKQKKDKAHRYSVQILSAPAKENIFKNSKLQQECYTVRRERFDAVRCGCFERYEQAKSLMRELQRTYPTAFVSNCDIKAYNKRHARIASKSSRPKPTRSVSKSKSIKENTKRSVQAKKTSKKLTLLDKIFYSFLYSEDLLHAQQVADLGIRQEHDRIKWLKRAIDVAIWRGDSQRAMSLMRQLYNITGDPKIRKKLLDYALQSYQYQQALYLMLQHPKGIKSAKDIKTVAYLYQQVGYPEKASDFLYEAWKKYPDQREWLHDALQIALNLGEIDKAAEMVKQLESRGINTLRGAELVSYYYFVKRQPKKSYRTLLSFNPNLLEDEEKKLEYYRKLTDLGWLVGDYKRAMEASYYLIRHGAGTGEDYDRVLLVASRDNPELALDVATDAFEKFKTEDYFYSAAYLAESLRDYERMSDLFSMVEENHLEKEFAHNPDYYLILSELDLHFKRLDAALQDLQKALEMSPGDPHVLSQMIWFYYDNDMTKQLKKIVAYIEANMRPLDPVLYPPLIAAYMKLQQSDLARFYMDKLYRFRKKKFTMDEQAGLAYLVQQQMRLNYYKYMLYKLFLELKDIRKKDKSKMKDPVFVDAWLRTAMEYINPDKFVKELKAAKKILPPERYRQIKMLWDVKQSSFERVNQELYRWKVTEPWIFLSLALHNHDLSKIQELIYRWGEILPIRDRVTAARLDTQIALAQTFAFKGMEENRWDYLLYYQREQLMREENDRYSIDGLWENRESLERARFVFKNRNELPRGWRLSEKVSYSRVGNVDLKKLQNVPRSEKAIDLSLTKRFDRGSVTGGVGYREAMDRYGSGWLEGEWRLLQRWRAAIGYYYHEESEDTTYLMLGGYMNRLHADIDYSLLSSTILTGFGEYIQYAGQDDVDAGEGWKTGLSLTHLFRTGYPDIQFSLYSELGRFNQRKQQQGLLRRLMVHPKYDVAIPSDYFIVGGGVYIGYSNYNDYIRAWRWYMGFAPYYDYQSNQGSVGGDIGIGGSLFQQDHLDLGIRYTPAFYNGQESLTTLYFLYRMMY